MTRRHITIFTFTTMCYALATASACEIRVRDSAFRIARDTHKLCLIAESSDKSADAIYQRLSQWLANTDDTFNLEIERIDADDPETDWQSIGIPSAPPSLPVTVLVGRDNGAGRKFVIDHWEPAPTDDELAAILDSPLRQQLARELARHVAVFIVAPSDPANEAFISDRMKRVVDSGVADERIGLSMIMLDRTDPAERLVAKFMGLRPDSPDTVCVAFGRGKIMSPPLVGDEMDRENIDRFIDQIVQACSCSKPLPTMGVDIPLVWSDEVDSTVILMDEELELSELDAEVQNMLAAKATTAAVTDPHVISIPPGTQPSASLPAGRITTTRLALVAVGLGVLFALVFVIAFSRRRPSPIDTTT